MTEQVHLSAYEEDLAYVHDVGYGGFAEGSTAGLLGILRHAGIRDGLIVDLGCGSGIWARHLTDAEFQVMGVDLSPAMIRLARERAPDAEFHIGSFLEFAIPRCRAITALGEVVCYQFDLSNNAGSLEHFLQRAHDALEPGGLLIFDIAEVGLDKGRAPTFREGADWVCLMRFEYDTEREQLTRYISTLRKIGALYRRSDEVHRLQLYRETDIARLLSKTRFSVRTVRSYGDYALLHGRVGFVARKGT